MQAVCCLTVMLLSFTACEDAEEFVEDETAATTVTYTLTNDDGSAVTLAKGWKIGVFVTDSDGKTTAMSGTVGENGQTVLPASAQNGSVTMYSPWQEAWKSEAFSTAPSFSVQDDQSTAAGYQASDLMMGYAAAGSRTVTMKHLLARVVVHIIDETGQMDFAHAAVSLPSMLGTVSVDLPQRRVTTQNVYSQVLMHAYAATDHRLSAEGIVVPQTVAAGAPLFALRLYGSLHTSAATKQVTLQSGMTYTFTMRLTEYGLIPDGSSITDWESDREETLVI